MLRSLFALALSALLITEASAQTAPAVAAKATAKSTKATVRANRRTVKKARRVALNTAAPAPVASDGWPAVEEPQAAVASAAPVAPEAPAAASRGEIDNANVYAAPGMPVHVRTSTGVVPYSIRPARKPARGQTTLSTGN